MTIEISSAELLHRVRDVAQDELAVTTPDETLRYKIEPPATLPDPAPWPGMAPPWRRKPT